MNTILLLAALKVLAIGNSFSAGLQNQLPSVAKALGQDLDLATMSAWGCTLDRHWACLTNAADHSYFLNWNRGGTRQANWPELSACLVKMEETADTKRGWTPKFGANLAEVVKAVKWDVVTVQQGSHQSWRKETYSPCGDKLVEFVRTFAPQARILVQETWSYTPWDKRLKGWGITPDEMAAKIHGSYVAFARRHGLGLIPMGSAVQEWRRRLPVKYTENSFGGDVCGSAKFERDEKGKWIPKGDVFHLNDDGNYLQALVWAAALFKVDVAACAYAPKNLAPERAALMKKVATETSAHAEGLNARMVKPDAALRLDTTEPVWMDFGPDGVGGYPEIVARPLKGAPKVRLSYGCYPTFGKNGDFWRETSARYLGPTVDLPILPANINRFDVFAVTNAGTYASPLQQGLQRYVRIQLEEAGIAVAISSVRFVSRGTHSEDSVVGSFACSDERLAALWKASVRTCQLAAIPARTAPLHLMTPETNAVLGVTHAYLSDGAKRDRLVWSGDLWWAQGNMYAAYAPDSPYLPGSLRMLAENQTPDGYVQACPYPESRGPLADGDYGPFPSDEFAAWFVPVLAAHYLHTGDRDLLEELFPNVRRLLGYLVSHTRDDFIFEQRPETSKHANGLAFGTSSVHHRSFINVLLWRTFRDAVVLAGAVGGIDEATDWRERAARYADVTRNRFLLPSGLLRTSLEDASPGLEATALALGTGFLTPDEAKRALAALPRIGHGKFQMMVVRGAFASGDPDAALARIAQHGWLEVVDPDFEGVRTTTECMHLRTPYGWGDEAHPDTALAGDLTAGVLGIVPLEPGYRRFAFRPGAAKSLDWAKGVVPTPHGPIKAGWRRVDGRIERTLECPKSLVCEDWEKQDARERNRIEPLLEDKP